MKHINLIKDADVLFKLINDCYNKFPNTFDYKKSKKDITYKILKHKFIRHSINICETDVYYCIINAFEKFMIHIKKYHKFESSRIFLTRNKHKHAFTPAYEYLGVCLEFYNSDRVQLRIKLSPYIGEFGTYEVGLGISFHSPHLAWVFKKYNFINDFIKEKIPITNLNPGSVYMYVVDCSVYKIEISPKSSQYEYDKLSLQKYCNSMNEHMLDLNLTFINHKFDWNRKYKLKKVSDETQNIIKFPEISSFIYEHKHSHRV